MSFAENWRKILRHAWSMHVAYAIAFLNGAYAIVDILTGALPSPPLWLALLNGVLAAIVVYTRLVPQKSVSGDQTNAQ